MGKGAPSGPSDEEIRAEADLERERVKFEDEKRVFVERVAGIELLKTERRRALETSLQVQGLVNPASYEGAAPGEMFSPSFNPSTFISNNPLGNVTSDDYRWFNAPNLGVGSGVQI